jgi:uncharacterized protein YggE
MTEKSNCNCTMSWIGIVLSIIALVAVFAVSRPAPVINLTPAAPNINVYGGNATTPVTNVMSISGTADLTVAPDQGIVYLDVLTEGKTAKDAQDQNRVIANKVIDAIQKTGITGDNIETSNYYLYKKTDYDPKTGKEIDAGYQLTHTLKVTTTDLEGLGATVDSAIAAGANGVNRITFGLTKNTEKQVRDQALAKATQAAKDKAESIAKDLGVKLVKITSVYESNFYYTPYDYMPNYKNDLSAGAMEVPSQISPQKVDVTSSISVTYEIT